MAAKERAAALVFLISVQGVADAECECPEAGERARFLRLVCGQCEDERPIETQLLGLIHRGVPMRVQDGDVQFLQRRYPVLYEVRNRLCQG